MSAIDLPGRTVLFHYEGMLGAQLFGRWQIDLSDHRRCRPLFSVRVLGKPCGKHLGPFCLRTGRLKLIS